MNIQFKKGVLEMCVLTLLSRKDCYGYELVQQISSQIEISEGTIYPLLRRLKDENYVTTYLQESDEGPPRKYYSLTEAGRDTCKSLCQEWFSFTRAVNDLIGGVEGCTGPSKTGEQEMNTGEEKK